MTDERFQELLLLLTGDRWPAHRRLFRLTRLAQALRHVVENTGPAGEAAFEKHCREREAQDNRAQQDRAR
jgi:hypothetical protein